MPTDTDIVQSFARQAWAQTFAGPGHLGTQPLLLALVQEMLSYRSAQDAGQNESEHHVDKWVFQPGRSIRTHFGFTLKSQGSEAAEKKVGVTNHNHSLLSPTPFLLNLPANR